LFDCLFHQLRSFITINLLWLESGLVTQCQWSRL